MTRVSFNSVLRNLVEAERRTSDLLPTRVRLRNDGVFRVGDAFAPSVDHVPAPFRAIGIPLSVGATQVESRELLDMLATRSDVPGANGVRQIKFLMTDVDSEEPALYLINTQNIAYHYNFYSEGLGLDKTLEEFNAETYFTDGRKNVAGSIIVHDNYEDETGQGLYTMEFWPTDPVRADKIGMVYAALKEAMPFAADRLAYHPAGETQEALFEEEKETLASLGVSSISTDHLFANVTYQAMNEGVSFGRLRIMDGAETGRPPSLRDVVLFKNTPNDLTHVAGIVTENPQTPLNHINLKAKQNNTPNAYVKDATTDPRFTALRDKWVRYEVGPDGVDIREATQQEVDDHFESIRPKETQYPPRNLDVRTIARLDDIGHADSDTYGAKAANVAELRKILPPGMAPDGFAVPFAFYDEFMKANGFYEAAEQMMADPAFKSDPAVREAKLKAFRKMIKRAEIPPELAQQLRAMHAEFPPGTSLRCRSATNNEDLPGFNGAGLYSSYTHRPDEGDIDKSIKQVWSSLWNYRAFEERDFYRIDHKTAAMGVLVHPNFDEEQANGVAITKNIYDENWPGFYVNVQVGEDLITNPTGAEVPEEFLISRIGEHGEYETQFIRRSSLKENGERVLTEAQTLQLRQAMERIQAHFKRVYGRTDKSFAMDIEFKIDRDGTLVIKQARPVVEPKRKETNFSLQQRALGALSLHEFRFRAEEAGALEIELKTQEGDADLYVKRGEQRADRTNYDHRSVKPGLVPDPITLQVEKDEPISFSVYGYRPSVYNMKVTGPAGSRVTEL